jgi:hypothetical protein
MCAVDGAIVASLVDDGGDLRATLWGALVDVVEALAPVR